MSKNILFCVVVLAIASTSYGASPFMFGGFNDVCDGYRDWSNQTVYIDNAIWAGKYTYTTTGKTEGTKALKITAGTGWQQNLSIKSYEYPNAGWPNGVVQGFLDSKYLAVDVTFVTADWVSTSGSDWAQIGMDIQGTNLGWEGMGRCDIDTSNPGYPGGWDSIHFGAIDHRTMYWDISYLHDGDFDNKEITATGTSGYINLIFETNCGGFTSGGVYYVDNVRYTNTPEPMTIALLGLGGLALRRRKH